MSRRMRVSEFLAAVEGMALMRNLFTGSDDAAARRLEELRGIVSAGEERFSYEIDVPALDVAGGYQRWSKTYDAPGNPVVSAEQPVVWELLAEAPAGRALDAACGTGRHTARLIELGHEVTGVDATAEMLALAESKLPGTRFVQGSLLDLPFEDDNFELVVCALALEHVGELEKAVGELARVLAPAGRVVISESHPALRAIGGGPFFLGASGAGGVVESHLHLHADYLDAFAAAGLTVRRCIDVTFDHDQVAMQQPAASLFPEATEATFLGFPGVLVWDVEA